MWQFVLTIMNTFFFISLSVLFWIPAFPLATVPTPPDWTVLIAVVVSFGGAALLVLLILGIIFCYKRRKEKGEAVNSNTTHTTHYFLNQICRGTNLFAGSKCWKILMRMGSLTNIYSYIRGKNAKELLLTAAFSVLTDESKCHTSCSSLWSNNCKSNSPTPLVYCKSLTLRTSQYLFNHRWEDRLRSDWVTHYSVLIIQCWDEQIVYVLLTCKYLYINLVSHDPPPESNYQDEMRWEQENIL